MGENNHWGFVECLLVLTLEMHIGLVCAITRHTVIIDTTAEALREHIAPRTCRRDFGTERKRVAVQGNARRRKSCSGRGKAIAGGGQLGGLWAPAHFPINIPRHIVEKRLSRRWLV